MIIVLFSNRVTSGIIVVWMSSNELSRRGNTPMHDFLIGATFVGPTQDRILALAKELNIRTFDTYDEGQAVYVNQGQRSTYSDTGPTGTAPPDPLILPELKVENIGLHVGGGPNDADTKAPFIRAIAERFPQARVARLDRDWRRFR